MNNCGILHRLILPVYINELSVVIACQMLCDNTAYAAWPVILSWCGWPFLCHDSSLLLPGQSACPLLLHLLTYFGYSYPECSFHSWGQSVSSWFNLPTSCAMRPDYLIQFSRVIILLQHVYCRWFNLPWFAQISQARWPSYVPGGWRSEACIRQLLCALIASLSQHITLSVGPLGSSWALWTLIWVDSHNLPRFCSLICRTNCLWGAE